MIFVSKISVIAYSWFRVTSFWILIPLLSATIWYQALVFKASWQFNADGANFWTPPLVNEETNR